MKDRYYRDRSKWAKVSGTRGRYVAALGWKGEVKAASVQTTDRMTHAQTIALNWINDQPKEVSK